MITQEQLKECSELEVNKRVAEIKGRKFAISNLNSDDDYLWCEDAEEEINYCQNPSEIMPLAFENKIGLGFNDFWGGWNAYGGDFQLTRKDPLRAVCEVYILMNQGADND